MKNYYALIILLVFLAVVLAASMGFLFLKMDNADIKNINQTISIKSSSMPAETSANLPSDTSVSNPDEPEDMAQSTNDKDEEYLFLDEDLLIDANIKALVDAVIRYDTEIQLYNIEYEDMQSVIDAAEVALSASRYIHLVDGFTISSSGKVEIHYSQEAVDDFKEAEDLAQDIAASLFNESMTDFEKVLAAHDYIVENTEYDIETYENSNVTIYGEYNASHSPNGVLADKIAVCDGYTYAMNMLLNLADIETRCIVSNSMNHMWSMVMVDNQWFHCDVTYDDPMPNVDNRKLYDFFLKNDEYMKKDDLSRIQTDSPSSDADCYYWDIYNWNNLSLNGEEYFYYLDEDTLWRAPVMNDKIDMHGQESLIDDVSSWVLLDDSSELLYTDNENNYIYTYNLFDGAKTLINQDADWLLIDYKGSSSKSYRVICIDGLQGVPLVIEVVKE